MFAPMKTLGAVLLGSTLLAAVPAMAEQVKITLLGVGDLYEFDGDGGQCERR